MFTLLDPNVNIQVLVALGYAYNYYNADLNSIFI